MIPIRQTFKVCNIPNGYTPREFNVVVKEETDEETAQRKAIYSNFKEWVELAESGGSASDKPTSKKDGFKEWAEKYSAYINKEIVKEMIKKGILTESQTNREQFND